MSTVALQLPQRHPRSFLVLAALAWLGLYRSLAPVSEAIVATLPVDRANSWRRPRLSPSITSTTSWRRRRRRTSSTSS